MPDIRDALAAAVQALLIAANTDAGSNVFLWRDWPLNTNKLPALVVRARRLERYDLTRGNSAPRYLLTVVLEVDGFTQAPATASEDTGLDAETEARTLEQQVDPVVQGIIIGPPQTFTRIAETSSEIDVTAAGSPHTATLEMRYAFEVQERFVVAVPDALEEVRLVATREFDVDSSVEDSLTDIDAGADFKIPQ